MKGGGWWNLGFSREAPLLWDHKGETRREGIELDIIGWIRYDNIAGHLIDMN